ncbi:methionyl-tRNA formyltransferase [Spirulina sp. CS-785/01]|uniref:methionyl-tRNA formyltransferase n=1 Tax=Spirulina sp. CS-785/01 TaxID=3021716 RepID=UPI00232F799E|nr:methionyl-tRNA formyltransferase [Spirulina sp. CS-785/01]MDB9313216.1 methionyl-tRNA formyltransferase [Spirulina sp. CS-785/01]
MKLVFFGTPQFAVPSLQKLLEEPEIEVLAVVTQPDKPKGRGKKLLPPPVKQLALEHNLPVLQPKRLRKDPEALQFLRDCEADFFGVVAYGQILSQEVLDMPKKGCINGHGSILPKYRGAAPIQWSLYHGETETGITTMLMDAGMDTGAMLLKSSTPIHLLDHQFTLADKLSQDCAELMVQTLRQLENGEIDPIPQNDEEATYAPLIQKADYQLDWTKSAISLHNQIRAFYPNCTTKLRDNPLKVLATVPIGKDYQAQLPTELQFLAEKAEQFEPASGNPGEMVDFVKSLGFIVQTGEGLLLIKEAKPAGKRAQSGWDIVNGMHLNRGEKLV